MTRVEGWAAGREANHCCSVLAATLGDGFEAPLESQQGWVARFPLQSALDGRKGTGLVADAKLRLGQPGKRGGQR